ncbi:MAG TPA: adenylate/guanylate cyclase domain-containing protein [Flavipsychrobacter sp.]
MRAAPMLFFALLLVLNIPAFGSSSLTDSLKRALSYTRSDSQRATILLELGTAIPCTDKKAKIDYLMQALKLAEEQNYQAVIMHVEYRIGVYYEKCLYNYDRAIEWHIRALRYTDEIANTPFRFQLLRDIAECYTSKADYSNALEYYRRILNLDIGRDTVIQILAGSGVLYQNMGEFARALKHYQEAYNLLHEDIVSERSPGVEDTLTLMGLKHQIAAIYAAIPDFERAIQSYEEVHELNKNINYSWFTAWADMGIGDCYLNMNNFQTAISNYLKAAGEIRAIVGSKNQKDEYLTQVLYKLAEAYHAIGEADSSYYYASQSLAIAEGDGGKGQLRAQLSAIYTTLGKIYTGRKQYNKALDYLGKAITISTETGATDTRSNAWLALSQAYERMGRTSDALKAYQTHIGLRDSIYSRKKLQELTRIDMLGDFERRQLTDSLKRAEEKVAAGYELQRQKLLTYSGFGGLVLLLLLSFFIFRGYRQEKKTNIIITNANNAITEEKRVSEQLLHNILPEEVAEELKEKGTTTAKYYESVTVMFTDFVNFTEAGERMGSQELVDELHTCFKTFDSIMEKYKIEKIKTIGDAYLAVSGLPVPNASHAENMVMAAIEIRDFMLQHKAVLQDRTFEIRIGIHSGDVVAGIVGVKKFAYDIWGDTVNTAARMEQSGVPGKINISQSTYDMVKDKFRFSYRGEIAAKNKGNLRMYLVEPIV